MRSRIISTIAAARRTLRVDGGVHSCPMKSATGGVLSDRQWADAVLLPHRQFATNNLQRGQYRMSRDDALAMRYVEHSPPALLGSIVIECDHVDAAMRAFEQPSDHQEIGRASGRGRVSL